MPSQLRPAYNLAECCPDLALLCSKTHTCLSAQLPSQEAAAAPGHCAVTYVLQTAPTVIAVQHTHTQQLAPVHTGGHVWILLPLPSCSALGLGCTVGAGNCMPGVGTQGAGLCDLPRLSSNRLEVQPGACPQGSRASCIPGQHSTAQQTAHTAWLQQSPAEPSGRVLQKKAGSCTC